MTMKQLNRPFKITRQTEKAVFVDEPDYKNAYFDGNEEAYRQGYWLPKSQIEIADEQVIAMAAWLARDRKIPKLNLKK